MVPPADGCAPVAEVPSTSNLLNAGAVYRQHVDAVQRTLRRLGVREAELEDATHDVFMVLLRRLGDYDAAHGPRQWLMGIARRVASTYRRSARRKYAFLDRFSQHPSKPLADPPELSAQKRQAFEHVREFLDQLDQDKCAVFVLSEIRGLTGPEIAEALDVNLNTVYWRLRAARQAFDKMVERKQRRAQSMAGFILWPFARTGQAMGQFLHTLTTATPMLVCMTTLGTQVDAAPRTPEARNLRLADRDAYVSHRWLPTMVPDDDGILVFPTAEPILDEDEEPELRKRSRRNRDLDGFSGRGRYVPRLDRPPADEDPEDAAAVARSSVFHTVRAHINEVRACYNYQVLARDPKVAGRVVVEFRIDVTGRVSKVDVDRSEIDEPMFAACVAETVRAWKFPAAEQGNAVLVRYPFVFAPDED